MTVYAARTRAPEKNYFADVVSTNGGSSWVHVRTNLGGKIAYAMIAKHYDGYGKIVAFRNEDHATAYDREQVIASDGKLHTNIWAGYSTRNECL